MLYTASILIVASCFEMAANDFSLCLEQGLAHHSPLYELKLVSSWGENGFHVFWGL